MVSTKWESEKIQQLGKQQQQQQQIVGRNKTDIFAVERIVCDNDRSIGRKFNELWDCPH